MLFLVAVALVVAADRVALPESGEFVAPAGKCVRVIAEPRRTVRVNGLAAGETSALNGQLDITGFLPVGRPNQIAVTGTQQKIDLLISPLVYLDQAVRTGAGVRVTVVNTTENTVQVELGSADQFTVSPGTSMTRETRNHTGATIRMKATSDGLDLVYEDELAIR